MELNIKTQKFTVSHGEEEESDDDPSETEYPSTDVNSEFMTEGKMSEIASMWDEMTNMDDETMSMWDEHPCADAAVDDGEEVRDETSMLMGQWPEGWNEESYLVANQHLAHIAEAMEKDRPEDAMNGGEGSCPTRWAINLLNRGVNPFEQMPGGNPEFTADHQEEFNFGLPDAADEISADQFDETLGSKPGDNQESTAEFLDNTSVAFAASSIRPDRPDLSGFNEYGVRENYGDDGELVSVDAVYEAMEPGEPEDRNGVRITRQFLKNVAEKDYSNSPPYLMDHDRSTLSQIGFVKKVWFSSSKDKLMVMARAYNTGSDIHDEVVTRLKNEPPTIPDGSVGFGESFDYERNDDDEVVLTNGRIQEFSTTPFPGGYDSGGLDVEYVEETPEATVVIDC